MTIPNLLVELFVEELPPKALKKLGQAFADTLLAALRAQGLANGNSVATPYASPRRLAAHITRVVAKAEDKPVQLKLMPVTVGLDADGQATPALLKKLQALGKGADAVAQLKRQRRVRGFDDLIDGVADALDGLLGQSEIGRASNKDKTALYNVLLAGAGLPLVVYVEGKQNKNDALVEQARTMAAGFSRKFFSKELQELTAMLDTGANANALAALTGAPAASAGRSGGGQNVDGRYDCQMAALQFDGVSYVTQYRPTGMWFVIKGGSYSAQSGGGTIQASSDVVSFRGGAYAGWSGARRGEAIVFRKDDQSNPRAGESIKSGYFRCGRRSG